ncbi:MAG: hypothetical protein KGJ07_01885 [Patescibacteria group bacterium]|nr:hypothetical protein [Patescibacteria group bacterium]MDE2590190.1 hypothetical protein [Patescibacteria group bacterium]
MLHLKPVSKNSSDPLVVGLYENILSLFVVETVPLSFQYLANFPDFFSYVWSKSLLNLHSSVFAQNTDQLISAAVHAIEEIYQKSPTMQEFVERMSPHEKAYLLQTVNSVMRLNGQLLLLSIGIRESIKGVFIGQKLVTGAVLGARIDVEEDFPTQVKQYKPRDVFKPEEVRITSTSSLLAPLFSGGLAVSSLPHFFAHIDSEMYSLIKTEKYLEKRVFLEQLAMQASYRLPYPFGASYQEILRLAGGKPYVHELLYLLVETFPTAYPRMLFTTAVMLAALGSTQPKSPVTLS